MSDTLVLLLGATATLRELERLLGDTLAVKIEGSTVSDAGVLEGAKEAFSQVLCLCEEALSLTQLSALLKILHPAATVVFRPASRQVEALRRNCVLTGFLIADDALLEQGLLRVKKAEWAVGTKTQVTSTPAAKWSIAVDDDDEMLDDDAFLNEEDLKPAPLIESTPPSDGLLSFQSGSGGKAPVKKACDNCTCGRAEGKEPVKLTQEMIDNPVTSCGSCGLGDAYRCATCPYRGLPVFEPGKKIELPEGFLISDL